MADLWDLSLVELARALRAGEVGARETCETFLARAADVHERLNCFVEFDRAGARELAAGLDSGDSGRPRAALHGVPFGAKDIFVGEAVAPTAGTRHMGLRMRARSAKVIDALRRSGAVPLGQLNLDPWGYAATGSNADLGDTRNPWDLDRLTGGSSSGAAAAVAGRALPFAIGADTGGSVRIPAALCGVVGLKPTFGRISRLGAIPLSYSQDTVGILARTAVDAALVLDQVAGYDPQDPGSMDVSAPSLADLFDPEAGERPRRLVGVRIGIHRPSFEQACNREVVDLLDAALDVLAGLGAALVDVDLSKLDRYDVAASVLTQAESAAVHGPAFLAAPERYPSTVRARLAAAMACAGSDHVDALRYQGVALRELLVGPLGIADVLLTPAAGGPPPCVEDVRDIADADAVRLSLELLRFHRPFSFTGLPALSLPIGFDSLGLPVAVQLASRPWSEARLLSCAAAYQGATDWHERSPGNLPTINRGAP